MRLWASLPVWGFNQPQPLLVWHLGRLPHIPQQRATAPKSWNHLILNPWFECLVLRVRETKAEQHKPLTAAFPQPTLPLGKSHDWSQKIHTLNHRQMHCTQTHSHRLSLSLSHTHTHAHTYNHNINWCRRRFLNYYRNHWPTPYKMEGHTHLYP